MKNTQPTNTSKEKPEQHPVFPSYDEGDVLNLDAIIPIPEPQQSGIIRVKLIYEEPSEPMSVEDPREK